MSFVSKLFGGGSSKALSNFQPAGFNAGGLSSTLKNNTVTVTPSADRTNLVSSLANSFQPQADFLQGLLDRVAPGFSDMRTSQLREIENARQKAIGDLSDNLSRRRVLGSSFGQDALTRANLEFGQEAEKTQASSLLQEIDMSSKLAQAEFETQRGQFQTYLDELNLQADVGTQLSSQATSQLGANARLKAQLDAQSSSGAGNFFGTLLGIPNFSKFFGGSSSANNYSGLSGTGGLY